MILRPVKIEDVLRFDDPGIGIEVLGELVEMSRVEAADLEVEVTTAWVVDEPTWICCSLKAFRDEE